MKTSHFRYNWGKNESDTAWFLKKVGIQNNSTKFNPFWRDIFLNWSTILEGEEVNDATHVKSQHI